MANGQQKKQQKRQPRPRLIAAFIVRILQIIFCFVTLGCAAYWAHTWAPFRRSSFQAYAILQSVNFAIFISASGMLGSTFLLLAPRLAPKLADDLPGLVDLLLSGIWSVFFLSMAGSLTSWGKCKSSSLCIAWNGTIGVGYFLWLLYGATAVFASMDLRDQLRALAGAATPAATQAPAPPHHKKGAASSTLIITATGDDSPSRPVTPPMGEQAA